MNKLIIVLIAILATWEICAQKNPDFVLHKSVQIGLTPGIGSNTIYDLKVENNISINLISGQSYRNNYFCFSGASNFQIQYSYGINLAGISNVVGGYPFLKGNQEKDSLAYMKAIQLAGLFNVVNGKGEGLQLTGGINSVIRSFDGVQISGFYNHIGNAFSGVQLSLLANNFHSIGIGVQTGLLLNRGNRLSGGQFLGMLNIIIDELDGMQVGFFNYIGNRNGEIYRERVFYWTQIGLLNKAIKNGDGFQLGVINLGRDIGFSQIGVVNFSNKIPQYPIGPINLSKDMEGYVRYYYNRIFPYNFEIGTGSRKVMNSLGYSLDGNRRIWGLSYSLGNQIKGGTNNSQYFIEYNIHSQVIFEKNNQLKDPQHLFGLRLQVGFNPFIDTKIPWMYFFIGATGKVGNINDEILGENLVGRISNNRGWLDLNFGVQL